ncbi:fasciclin domain-containing protein [Arthrospira platensis FACHB-971]|jgi:uncharacterized surface protein with fasciclin (FAS1) repeats|uniref:Fasciclin domain protein n=2 Tax=Oscillatoriophycideae TaxID=1301283 RepID=A0A5M3T8W5_LIMPL|nr:MULTISPECIES: fasciclin domain-containing protein [Arthrospira]AMW27658.1 fasciclin [Arthrospira platensis YZ]KDR58119.1 fasciclin [Arthrospira platensis str. Paraca]MBD2573441.1 fasciclin domain-containing protein [Arthrospira platensis FACHB-971]MBD2669866.1 fasciclin domain-containing protein [Arthrospira platensis FACHB-439]MBD2711889.1 fasciclin domain-containing protein [Arthrospira platensis FACHB-835]MDT9310823.1 fasciclin domain-containing protein [Limnospira sp. Paracas R14]QQW3
MTLMAKRLLILLVTLGGTAFLAACGEPTATETQGEPTEQIAETSEPVTAETVSDETIEAQAEPAGEEMAAVVDSDPTETIVGIASGESQFSTLVAALETAELAEILSGEGPFTVFAPTDEAFAALPEGTVEELLKPENRDQLVQILTYHVVPSQVLSANISDGSVETVAGMPLTITVMDGTVMVNEASVIQADILGSNGVIHAVDTVILPGVVE